MKKDLTKGSIFGILIKLAIPIMATSLLNMTYNMVDIFWLGHLGNEAVASVGTAGFYINLGYAVLAISFVSSGIAVSHRLGEKKKEEARSTGENAVFLSGIISVIYICMVLLLKRPLLEFFGLGQDIKKEALAYLSIAIWSVLFTSLNLTISRIMNSYGNSKTPFWISSIGLVSNIILDPIFIFVLGMGVRGAAIATLISNFAVAVLFFSFLLRKYEYFIGGFRPRWDILKKLVKLGIPVSIQRTLFTSIAIILGKIVASFGAEGISAHRIGLQIESISYMTAGGFQGALSVFVGQNYGAGIYERIRRGYFKGIGIIVLLAIFISFAFYFKADTLVSIFIDKKEVVEIGSSYLKIIAFSQIFMVMEITTVGAFNGIGKTFIPSINSVIFTGLRIPMALFLVGIYGINGIWLSITISSIIKGSSLLTFFCMNLKKLRKQLT